MANPIQDGYERYYAEKLWELIPAIYRHEDGLADNPNVLRGLVEVLATQAAVLRRSQDRLWDDAFIELCDDWAIPYIGELVGTRLISALNRRGQRIDVAKTIYYRRRSGTLRIQAELIRDITGWNGQVVEQFRRLGRQHHGLDPQRPYPPTPPGGWADLRLPRLTEQADGPFDRFAHTADVRRQRGDRGRYNIPKVAYYLYRLRALRVEDADPFSRSDRSFLFDPSGRDIPLFMPPQVDDEYDWDTWTAAQPWQVPAPIACRLLGHAEYRITEATVQDLVAATGLSTAAASDLRTLRGGQFASAARLRQTLASLDTSATLLDPVIFRTLRAIALIDDCGKMALWPTAIEVKTADNPVAREQMTAANLAAWSVNAPETLLAVDPERGRGLFPNDDPELPLTVSYYVGAVGEIGAGTYDRPVLPLPTTGSAIAGGGAIAAANLLNADVTQIADNRTYSSLPNKLSVQAMTFQAANQMRPYVEIASNWTLSTGSHEDSTLLLNGLWIGARSPQAIVLRGDYERVTLRHCTLDPGGDAADGTTLGPITLIIAAQIETLVIESSILGPVQVADDGLLERLILRDSIVQSRDGTQPALDLANGSACLERVTVLGAVSGQQLQATDSLITGLVTVTDTQSGCFRFSAAPPGSRLPQPYRTYVITDANHYFTSRQFGHPAFAQLSETAPVAVRRGAENGAEMGAYSGLLNPIKLDSLKAKVAEYLPFGLIPMFIYET
ncbi:hypothetical protein [Halomicronema sp. CCY15110]|uniref:hypothetical protein n=1 Tax=Halomicronema sp. CCY15110 TaxID=2767773 RepID=UPI00194E60A6|nr:hypothetical protein [Halomicronema sp. CCY15110]